MRREEGSALLVTVLLLVLLGVIGFAALDTAMRDQQVAGYANRARLAFYAAEAGLAQSRNILLSVGAPDITPPLPVATVGDAGLYPHGLPSYMADPAFPNPIRSIGSRPYTDGMNLRAGRPMLVETFWRLNVMGQTPDGALSRLDAAVSTLGNDSAGYGG